MPTTASLPLLIPVACHDVPASVDSPGAYVSRVAPSASCRTRLPSCVNDATSGRAATIAASCAATGPSQALRVIGPDANVRASPSCVYVPMMRLHPVDPAKEPSAAKTRVPTSPAVTAATGSPSGPAYDSRTHEVPLSSAAAAGDAAPASAGADVEPHALIVRAPTSRTAGARRTVVSREMAMRQRYVIRTSSPWGEEPSLRLQLSDRVETTNLRETL